KAACLPIEFYDAAKLTLNAGNDCPTAITALAGRRNSRSSRFLPEELKLAVIELPCQVDAAGLRRQCAVFGGVGGELMQCERNGLSGRRRKHDDGSFRGDPFPAAGAIRSKFFVDKAIEVSTFPTRAGQQSVGIGQRADAAIESADIVVNGLRAGQPHNRLHDGDDVARAVIDFLGKQNLPFFGPLALGDIDDDPAKPYQASLFVEVRNSRSGAPADIAA